MNVRWILRPVITVLIVLLPAHPARATGGRFPSRFSYWALPNEAALDFVVGDVNGDGRPDVLTRNTTSGSFSLLLGSSQSELIPFGTMTLDASPSDLALARIDGDARDDVVISSLSFNTVTMRPGLAEGGFGPARTIATPQRPSAIACADVNGDGRTDLVVTTYYEAKLRVYLQQPDGSFVLSSTAPAPAGPNDLVLADLNGDGALDAVVVGTSAHGVYLNSGNGTLIPTGFPAPGGSRAFVGDFNHDGIKDLIVGPDVFVGTGGGAFGAPSQLPMGGSVVAVGDWNQDGIDDLAVRGSDLVFYEGGPDLTFPPLGTAPGPTAERLVALADFDGDGKLDLVTAGTGPGVAVAAGHGDGTFGDDQGSPYPLPNAPAQVEMADLDGDFQLDVAARVGNSINTYLTAANGALTLGPTIALPRTAGRFCLRDMNGDGRPDVVALLLSPAAVKTYLQQADGSYLGMTENPTATSGPLTVTTGLIDTNLYPDAVVGEPGRVSTFLGLGNGTFQSTFYTVSASSPTKVVISDVTGDGQPDAVVQDGGNILVYPGTGHPWFEPGILQAATNSSLIAVQDVDQVGLPDIVVWNTPSHAFVLYPNDGLGSFGPAITLDSAPGSGDAAFADIDGDGNLDMVIQRTSVRSISILYGHGRGVFGPEQEGIGLDADARPVVSDFNGDGRPDLFLIGTNFFRVLFQTPTQVAADPRPPARIALSATPNPARGAMSLGYSVPRAGSVELGVYDLHGRLVKELFSGTKPAGEYRQPWDGRDGNGVRAPAGVYFARGSFDGHRTVTKLVLMN